MMKTFALISLILSGLLIIPVGFGTIITFLMSFDAPDSATDLKQWVARIGMIVLVLLLLGLVYYGYQAYQAGNYQKTLLFTAIPVVVVVGGIIYTYASA
jgi:cytochrome b561